MNILFVSIAFPPKNDPECLQTAKYYKYLSKQVSRTEVVTSESPTLFMPVDLTLNKYINYADNIIQIPLWESKWLNRILNRTIPAFNKRPDSKFAFHLQAKKALRNLETVPDVIYSRSFPLSSTIMAYKLQRRLNKPWVLHLSDPWTLSPLLSKSEKDSAYHKRWEEKCLSAAAAVCFTSAQTVKLYKKAYPEYAHKFEYFPNVYDPADQRLKPLVVTPKLTIVYTGGLAAKRSPEFFLEALDLLYKQNPAVKDSLEVIFAGETDRANAKIFTDYNLPFVKHIGSLPYSESILLQEKGHLLLTIDNPFKNPEEAVFFPSKLLDYMLAQRRLIAITTPDSPTATILNTIGGAVFNHGAVKEIAEYVQKCLDKWQHEKEYFYLSASNINEFSAEYQAQRLVSLFKKIV